jgi:hypothetical protein
MTAACVLIAVTALPRSFSYPAWVNVGASKPGEKYFRRLQSMLFRHGKIIPRLL